MENLSLLNDRISSVVRIVKSGWDIKSGNVYTFNLPNTGTLKNVYLKVNLKTVEPCFNVRNPIGLNIFSSIKLISKNSTLHLLTPESQGARYDLIRYTPLFAKINIGVHSGDATLSDGYNFYIPCWFWFSEKNNYIDLSGRGSMTVECTLNAIDEIGLGYNKVSTDVTRTKSKIFSIIPEMYCKFEHFESTKISRPLINTVNTYVENEIISPPGSIRRNIKLLLTSPYENIYSHFSLHQIENAGSCSIESISIDSPDSNIMDIPIQLNYSLDDPFSSFDISTEGTWTIKWGSREILDNHIRFGSQMTPSYATISFVTKNLDDTYVLKCNHEYRSIISTSYEGFLYEDISGVFNSRKQTTLFV